MVVLNGYTGSTRFSDLRTEFGFAGSIPLSSYRIGGGFTANHENNSGLPTTNSNLAVSKWWRKDKDYESNAGMGYTGSASWIAGEDASAFTSTSGANFVTTGIDLVGFLIGTAGVIDVVGTSKLATTQAALVAVFNQVSYINFGGSQTQTSAFVSFQSTGTADIRGTWWTSVTVTQGATSVTLNRADATTPNGLFDGVYTYWDWFDSVGPFNSYFPFTNTAAHSIRITL